MNIFQLDHYLESGNNSTHLYIELDTSLIVVFLNNVIKFKTQLSYRFANMHNSYLEGEMCKRILLA